MPIVSSQIVKNRDRGTGRRVVHEEHVDHNGKIHEYRYHCPLDYDVDAALISNAVKVDSQAIENEKEYIFRSVSNGSDPTLLDVNHLTALQKAKQVLRALMFGEAKNVIKAAEYVSSFTDAQIENHFTPSERIRIRARQDYVLTNQSVIETDDTQREEL